MRGKPKLIKGTVCDTFLDELGKIIKRARKEIIKRHAPPYLIHVAFQVLSYVFVVERQEEARKEAGGAGSYVTKRLREMTPPPESKVTPSLSSFMTLPDVDGA